MIKAHHFAPFEKDPPAPDQLFAQYLETIEHSLDVPPTVSGSSTPDTAGGQ